MMVHVHLMHENQWLGASVLFVPHFVGSLRCWKKRERERDLSLLVEEGCVLKFPGQSESRERVDDRQ